MPWWTRLSSRLRLTFGWLRARREEREMHDEMRFHLDRQTEKNRAAGMSDAEARRAAHLAFGGVQQWAEAGRDEYRSRLLDEIAGDVRYAVRSLRRAPTFTIAVMLSLAVGIGATSTVYTVADRVVLRPLPYMGSGQLLTLWTNYRDKPNEQGGSSLPDFLDWTTNNPDLESAAAFNVWFPLLSGGAAPEPLFGGSVTPAFFRVLGAAPMLGRTFRTGDDVDNGGHVVVISHSLWVRHFAGDPNAVGKPITLGGIEYSVIGVMPAGFRNPEPQLRRQADAWRPLVLPPGAKMRGVHFLRGIARLRPGVSLDQARRRFDLVMSRLAVEFPRSNRNRGVLALPMQDQVVGPSRPLLFAALGASLCVLIIACANVATLVLARHSLRAPEVALRSAIGATRRRVARMFFVESLVLAVAGGVLGVCLSVIGTTLLRHVAPPGLPRVEEIVVDGRIVAVTMALTLGTALVFGLVPALRASREDLATLIQDTGMRSSRPSRSRGVIVSLEIALALLLLVSTGLLAKSLMHLNSQPLGLDTGRLLSFRLVSPAGRFSALGSHDAFVARLTTRLLAQPGVLAVASTSSIPLTGNIQTALLAGSERHPLDPGLDIRVNSVSAGYFATVGIPLIAGREFGPGDVTKGAPVAIINQAAARQIFPGENPVGQHFLHGIHDSVPPTIVGIVADVRTSGPLSEPKPELIEPESQSNWGGTDSYVVRTSLPPAVLLPAIRDAARATAPDLAVADLTPMADLAAAYTARQRFYGSVFGIFAFIALSLAAIGVYGLIAYTVMHRRREIAIRSALGAGTWDLLRRFVGQASLLTLIGVIVGAAASLVVARLLQSLLYDVSPTDAGTILLAALVLAVIAIGASVIPVLRARRISLAAALRSD